jgi:hypothetical protein
MSRNKKPHEGGAIIHLIWSPELLRMEKAFAGHILWL